MSIFRHSLVAAVFATAVTPAVSQTTPVRSAEVQNDGRVVFRLRAPNAQRVTVHLEGAKAAPMQKGDDGIWSATTDPLAPDIYGYTFNVDGVTRIDAANPSIKPNLLGMSNMVHVPGPASLPWDIANVPHGTIHHHVYHSAMIGDDRDLFVYTPPGYDAAARKKYPVLYLLHGFSDDASAWTAVGRANIILDNLIAQGKAKPMVVVMPLGYGVLEYVYSERNTPRNAELRKQSITKFRDALFAEVIPNIESNYRVLADRNSRAIAGLSMGGATSVFTGLNGLDRFAWIGAFSQGPVTGEFDAVFPALTAKANSQLRLFWIGCGTEDSLIANNRKFREWLTSKGITYTAVETPGAHTWMVWRRYLATFAPLLFQPTT
jgi:enterochelin esterase family protein